MSKKPNDKLTCSIFLIIKDLLKVPYISSFVGGSSRLGHDLVSSLYSLESKVSLRVLLFHPSAAKSWGTIL